MSSRLASTSAPSTVSEQQLYRVLQEELSVDDVLALVRGADAGGNALFVGTVRDQSEGRRVSQLEYHAYVAMAEKEMQRIARQLEAELPGLRTAVHHRIGLLQVGEIAVVCATASPHRGEALRGVRELIDRIKADVPIWKREYGPEGAYWVGWADARCHGHEEQAHEKPQDHAVHGGHAASHEPAPHGRGSEHPPSLPNKLPPDRTHASR